MYQFRPRLRLALLVLGLGFTAPVVAFGANVQGLFASVEFRTAPLDKFGRWERVRRVLQSERLEFSRCAAHYKSCRSPQMRWWTRFVAAIAGLPPGLQLAMVNSFFNGWGYRTDTENYGVSEHWASPAEFMLRSGDCEDYALTKFFALGLIGFRDEQMRIVIVRDKNRSTNHAVLAVYQDTDALILDNTSIRIVSHRSYPNYVPRVSFNEGGYWAHLSAGHLGGADLSAADKPF